MTPWAALEAGIEPSRESVPDATTLLKFRRQLGAHGLTRKIFEAINAHLAEQGLILREGTSVDARLIAAPLSTKSQAKVRDPEMHQTKKGKNWHFGLNAHIGVDAHSGRVHVLVTTAAKTSDVSQAHALLLGQERTVFGGAGYQGLEKRPANQGKTVEWLVAMKRSVRKALSADDLGQLQVRLGKLNASIRAKVEHPFHMVKTCSGTLRPATVGWRRTRRTCSRCLASPIYSSPKGAFLRCMSEVRPER